MTLLELDTVTVQYGRAVAVDGVSLYGRGRASAWH